MAQEQTVQGAAKKISGLLNPKEGQSEPVKPAAPSEQPQEIKEETSKEDYESMKKLLEELQQELYAVGSSVYQQPGNQPPSPGPGGGPDQSDSNEKGGDDVIDADFTETKD